MKVFVDRDLCEANGVCERIAPRVFSLEANDRLTITSNEIPPELRAAVEAAVRSCPRGALEVAAVASDSAPQGHAGN